MAKTRRNHRIVLITVTVIALTPFIFFSLRLQPWQGVARVASIWQEAIYPFEYAWDSVLSWSGDTVHRYVTLSHAADENEELRKEVTQLGARLLDYEEKKQELQRLRKLLGFTMRYPSEHMIAEVVGNVSRTVFRSLRVSRGFVDGVRPGMPVVTSDGIVGRVIRVGTTFSDIQVITDPNFSLDVLIQRTRVRGVIRGANEARCHLSLNRRAEMRIGDLVVSSGIVGGFPKGLPVGRVVRISYESDNVTQNVTIEPWVDVSSLEEVIILKQLDHTTQKIMETAGSEWLEKAVEQVEGG